MEGVKKNPYFRYYQIKKKNDVFLDSINEVEVIDFRSDNRLKFYPDVKLISTENHCFHFHKFYLIQEDYFSTVFNSGFKEAKESSLNIQLNSFDLNTFCNIMYRKSIIQFFPSNTILSLLIQNLITKENKENLFNLSHQLMISWLQEYCT